MNNTFDFENTPLFDTLKKIRETYENSLAFSTAEALQEMANKAKEPMNGVLEAAKALQAITKAYEYSNSNAIKNLQLISQSVSAAVSASNALHLHSTMNVLKDFDFSALSSVAATSHIFDSIPDDISFDTVSELIENGEITDEDFKAEIKSTITGTENEAIKSKPSKIKKVLKTIAIKFFLFLLVAVISPVTDTAKNEIVEAFKVDKFWQNTGIIDWIESWSEIGSAATEDEAKATVDESKTGNISKQKRKDLLNKIEEIRKYISNAPQDENTGNLLSYLSEIEKDVNGKKYGLVFEEHREDIDEVLDTHTPVLTEETDLFIDNGGQMNFLIEGDNLASLKLLEKTHRGSIKMIYIDPPYNTANKDFAYDDTRVDLTDTFRHSKWLSFMKQRLITARNLLKDDGIIFISIDDNEQADLKLLCDEIFKEENFFSQIIIQSNKRGQTYKQIAKTHEYLLVYTRSPDAEFNEIEKSEDDNDLNLVDSKGAYNVRELRNRNPKFGKHNRPNLFYPIFVNPNIIDKDNFSPVSLVKDDNYCIEVYPYNSTGAESCWRWGTKLFNENTESDTQNSNVVARKKKNGSYNIYEKYRKTTYKAKSIWNETDVITEKGTVELGKIGLAQLFSFPKPLFLIKKCLQIGTNSNDIVLDFFAGSGTTGHAVMKLNSEDGGNRKFILCTNNENNICRDVTYERIKRVIEKDDYNASLKYYRVEYVPITERLYYEYADELLKHIRELVELENGINFMGNSEIAIVLTDEELSEFTSSIEQYSACKKLYMGHDLLPDEEQERIIKENDIEISIIPDYYYKDLQEK